MSVFVTKSFRYAEFACPCCGKTRPINPNLIYRLQNLRDKINLPIYITSGIRCKKENKRVGGYSRSPHLTGKAVDIYAKKTTLKDLAIAARDVGFTRVGLYPDNHFIHIDIIRPWGSASWIRRKGIYIYYKTLELALKVLKWYNQKKG